MPDLFVPCLVTCILVTYALLYYTIHLWYQNIIWLVTYLIYSTLNMWYTLTHLDDTFDMIMKIEPNIHNFRICTWCLIPGCPIIGEYSLFLVVLLKTNMSLELIRFLFPDLICVYHRSTLWGYGRIKVIDKYLIVNDLGFNCK